MQVDAIHREEVNFNKNSCNSKILGIAKIINWKVEVFFRTQYMKEYMLMKFHNFEMKTLAWILKWTHKEEEL